jgi:hypothetical protein
MSINADISTWWHKPGPGRTWLPGFSVSRRRLGLGEVERSRRRLGFSPIHLAACLGAVLLLGACRAEIHGDVQTQIINDIRNRVFIAVCVREDLKCRHSASGGDWVDPGRAFPQATGGVRQ